MALEDRPDGRARGRPRSGRARACDERAEDREHLWQAFQDAGVAAPDVPAPPVESAPVDEALAFVAATPAPLVTYPLEDLLALADQPNLPGSIDEHPNWRRRLALPVDELFLDESFADRLLAVDSARARSALNRLQRSPPNHHDRTALHAPAAASQGLHLRRCRAPRSTTSPRSGSATRISRRSRRRPAARPTATTRSTTRASIPNSAARKD